MKPFNLTMNQRNVNEHAKSAKIKKKENAQYWQGCEEENLTVLLVGM